MSEQSKVGALGAASAPLDQLREMVVEFQNGTKCRGRGKEERAHVAGCQGTLAVMLEEIDKLRALPSAPPSPQEQIVLCACGTLSNGHDGKCSACRIGVMMQPSAPPVRAAREMVVRQDDQGDYVCEHGVAMDVHCCNCHSGFIFDRDHVCVPDPEEMEEALRLIVAEPHGCPMCDSGKLRDPQKEHWDTCGFAKAQSIIAALPSVDGPRQEKKS